MAGTRYRSFRTSLSDPEREAVSDEKHETEVDRQIKELFQKQTKTDATLKEQLKVEKKFESVTEQVSLTKIITGTSSLEDVKEAESLLETIQNLKSCGLTNDEIKWKLDNEKGQEYFDEKYSKVDSNIMQERFKLIEKKIDDKFNELLNGNSNAGCSLSRHALELEMVVNASTEKNKLLSFLVNRKKAKLPLLIPDSTINLLKRTSDKLSAGNLDGIYFRKRTKTKPVTKITSASASFVGPSSKESLWDVKTVPQSFGNYAIDKTPRPLLYQRTKDKIQHMQKDLTKEEKEKTNRDNSRTFVMPVQQCSLLYLSVDDILKNRMAEEDFQKIERFRNYSCGVPSKVLYIKNLPRNVTKEDLISVFHAFQEDNKPNIIYRLLQGRMKEQAFITLPDVPAAENALSSVHRFLLNGKPMVIEYGKSDTVIS